MTKSVFKVGDNMAFVRNITPSYGVGVPPIIKAFDPCVIVKINNSHVTVLTSDGEEIKLRNIPERMIPAGDLSKLIFGE